MRNDVRMHGFPIDEINHIKMRSDMEHRAYSLHEDVFFVEDRGQIGSDPVWEIDSNNGIYSYDSKTEYDEDRRLVGLL